MAGGGCIGGQWGVRRLMCKEGVVRLCGAQGGKPSGKGQGAKRVRGKRALRVLADAGKSARGVLTGPMTHTIRSRSSRE